MKAVRGTLTTLALLVGVWAVLGIIGFTADVLPDLPSFDSGGDDTDPDAGVADSGLEALDAGDDVGSAPDPVSNTGDAGSDAPADVESDAADAASTGTSRTHAFQVCESPDDIAHGLDRSFVVGELLAGGPPEIVIGCADRFVVIGAVSGPAGLTAMRLAELTLEGDRAEPKHTALAAIGDVTGDGKNDLVFPFYFRAERGGSRGGRLILWRRTDNGFARPQPLGQHTFQNVLLSNLDGRGGLDLVVVDRGQPWAERAGSVRVYQGGTRPRERTEMPAGKWARDAGALDLDLDGVKDIVVISDGAMHVHRRRDGFRFDDPIEVGAERHWGLAIGDLDGDGNDDAVVGGSGGLAVLYARQREGLEGVSLDSLSTAGSGAPVPAQIVDTNADGRNDVLALDRGVVVFQRTATGVRKIANPQFVRTTLGAHLFEVDDTPVLATATLHEGRITLSLVEHPNYADPRAPEPAALPDAPFLAQASVR